MVIRAIARKCNSEMTLWKKSKTTCHAGLLLYDESDNFSLISWVLKFRPDCSSSGSLRKTLFHTWKLRHTCTVKLCLPDNHLGNSVTSLLRALFLAARQNGYTLSCKKTLVSTANFFVPLVTVLTGLHCIKNNYIRAQPLLLKRFVQVIIQGAFRELYIRVQGRIGALHLTLSFLAYCLKIEIPGSFIVRLFTTKLIPLFPLKEVKPFPYY